MRVLLLACAAATALAACSRPSDEAFGQRVRAYLLEHPEVLEEAITKLEQTRTAEASATQVKAVQTSRAALERDPRDPVLGNPNGAVTVVEFFDYRCGFCKTVAPDLLRLLEQEKDVRLVMKELPILPDPNGRIGVSERAARAALVAAREGKYLPVHRDLMAQRALDDAAITRVVQQHGLDPARVAEVGGGDAVDDHLTDVQELAEQIGVNGTPAFIVGNKVIPGADIEALRAAIAEARKGAPKRS